MSPLIPILLTLALACMLIYVIAENRQPMHTLAWVIVIIFLPVIGLILYFLIGHHPWHRTLIQEEELRQYKDLTRQQNAAHIVPPPEEHNSLAAMMQSTNQAFPMDGNAIRPYLAFYPMLDDMIADLEKAEDHIHFEFFKFENDPAGQRVADVLMRKAREGVTVRVQYDDAANLTRKRFYRKLKEAGVEVRPFLALNLPFISEDINFRNHRKIVVIDGKIGYLGGMNIAARYGDGLSWGPWRDSHMRVEGPAVAELQTVFLSDWRFSKGELLAEPRYYPVCPTPGDVLMQIIPSGPMGEWDAAMQGLVRLISNARDYVYIESPYFIPTTPVMLALKNAALAGKDIRVMMPWRGDRGKLVPLASRSYIEEALQAGVKVYFYRKGYLHSKTVVSDDTFTTIGSTNVDIRSYQIDFEINAYLYNPEAAVRMREAFFQDMEDCEQVVLESWSKRSRFEKFKESFARLFSPLL